MTDQDTRTRFRFAAAPFANSMPLAQFLRQASPSVDVQWMVPSLLADCVMSGKADVGLMPVAELLARPELAMIDGLGVCARQRAISVLLKCFVPIERVRFVAADPASRTSNALAGLILRRHLKRDVPVRQTDEGQRVDAAVVIGDRAMTQPPAPCGDYDLAQQWREMTGLPFVFALWAYRAGHPGAAELADIARSAKGMGIDALEQIAGEQAVKLGLSMDFCRRYFTQAIHYEVGPQERQAIRLFGQLLAEDGVIAAGREGRQ